MSHSNTIFPWLYMLTMLLTSCGEQSNVDNTEKIPKPVHYIMTKFDKSVLHKEDSLDIINNTNVDQTLVIDPSITYQTMDGWGYTLTGGSADLIAKMDGTAQEQLLNDIFNCKNGRCFTFIRISIGASDLDASVFTYNDMPDGQEDPNLLQFSIQKDMASLIPVLKKIKAIQPSLKLIASPWTAPSWMKNNKQSKGGSLLEKYYSVYASYFIKYLQAYENEGLKIDAVTIQNEPANPLNNPSMVMTAEAQNIFIRDHLGPAIAASNIKTKLIIWDHNCDDYKYPLHILDDAVTNTMVDGSAFHLYGGDIGAMSLVHNVHPDKNLYFTEQWTSSEGKFDQDLVWHTKNIAIGASRNWAKVILEWNLANDNNTSIHTPGGCSKCLGALTIDGSTYKKNVAYYILSHLSQYVTTGSKRINSTYFESLPNVAFIRPDGKKVVHILNEKSTVLDLNISENGKFFTVHLEPQSLTTFLFK